MVGLQEIGVETQDFGRSTTSTLKAHLGGPRRLLLKHNFPSHAVILEASTATTPAWTLGFNVQSKEVFVETKNRPTRLGALSIRQRVPHQKLYLVPSPEVKLAAKPLHLGQARAETTLNYDFMFSTGTIQQDLIFRDRYKASVTANSRTGPRGASVLLNAKTSNSLLSTVGLSVSRATGPVLKLEGNVLKGARAVRVKADVQLQGKDMRLEVSPPAINKLRLSLTGSLRTTDKQRKPSVVLGAKVELQ